MSADRRDRDERDDARRRPDVDVEYAGAVDDEGYVDYQDEEEREAEEHEPVGRRDDYDEGGVPAPVRGEHRGRGNRLTAVEAAEVGVRQITALTAKGAEGVTSVEPTEDGWAVGVELLDARRIPSSSDTLALYEVEIYTDGELKSYRRVARYSRARGSEAS